MNLDDYRSGSTEPWTVGVLRALVLALPARVLIETGTFEGRTTRAVSEVLLPGAHLYSIEADADRARAAAAALADCPNVSVAHRDALSAMAEFADAAVDFVFLDDDHTADHVALELIEARRILRPGGVCAVHDVLGPFGLDRLVRLAGGVCLPFAPLHVAGGLGLIVKRD